jgi:hypothetical protein
VQDYDHAWHRVMQKALPAAILVIVGYFSLLSKMKMKKGK